MKKKLLILFVCYLFCSTALFASFEYKFDAFSFDPIYKEYFADRARPDFSISQISYFDGYPDRVLQDTHVDVNETNWKVNKYVKLFLFDELIQPENKFVALKMGETMSLARSTFIFDHWLSPISFDISMQALLQNFYRGSFDDTVSYDGIYFLGGTFRFGDVVSMRMGLRHYCSHYGDATLKRIRANFDDGFGDDFYDFGFTYKYVRMNGLVFGLSLDLTPNFRVYGEYNIPPQDINSIRPDMFAPNWVTRDGVVINEDYPNSYKARIISLGFEYSFSLFKNLGKTTIGYDLHMYEEGKIQYSIEDDDDDFEYHDDDENDEYSAFHYASKYFFDPDAPWELEHNFKIAQELDKNISFEIAYHHGRSVMNSFFFQQTSTLTMGLRFNPDYTVNVFDSSKN